jgi:SAM-dependent methyltransferase
MSGNNETITDKLIGYGMDIGKQLALMLIKSKLGPSKKEIANNGSNLPVKSKKGGKLKFVRNIFLTYMVKELVIERLKAKIMLKPDSKDFSWLLDYPLSKQLVDLNQYIDSQKDHSLALDLGSGSGNFAINLAKHIKNGRVFCVDINYEALKKLQTVSRTEKVANIEFHRANIEKLPFEDNTFDVAFLNMTIGQIHDKIKALSEIKRVLKKGGYLYITELLIDHYYCLFSNVLSLSSSAGLTPVRENGNFINYTLVLRKE